MDPDKLAQLTAYYESLSDEVLNDARQLARGGHLHSEVWQIIEREFERRGIEGITHSTWDERNLALLTAHYESLSDEAISDACQLGRGGCRYWEAWQIIKCECERRGLAGTTDSAGEELEDRDFVWDSEYKELVVRPAIGFDGVQLGLAPIPPPYESWANVAYDLGGDLLLGGLRDALVCHEGDWGIVLDWLIVVPGGEKRPPTYATRVRAPFEWKESGGRPGRTAELLDEESKHLTEEFQQLAGEFDKLIEVPSTLEFSIAQEDPPFPDLPGALLGPQVYEVLGLCEDIIEDEELLKAMILMCSRTLLRLAEMGAATRRNPEVRL